MNIICCLDFVNEISKMTFLKEKKIFRVLRLKKFTVTKSYCNQIQSNRSNALTSLRMINF